MAIKTVTDQTVTTTDLANPAADSLVTTETTTLPDGTVATQVSVNNVGQISDSDAARIRAEYAALIAQQRAAGVAYGSGLPRRLQVTRAYQGHQSSELPIYVGVYFEDDSQLHGLARYLVENQYAEYMA